MKNKLKIFYYFVQRHIKFFIILYLILMLPFGYIMTSLTTKYELKDYKKVTMAHLKSGPINITTMGISKPFKSLIYVQYGHIQYYLGDLIKNKTLIHSSENIIILGKSWFELGSSHRTVQSKVDQFNYFTYPKYYHSLGLSNLNQSKFPDIGHIEYSKNEVNATFSNKHKLKSNHNYKEKIKNNRKVITFIDNKKYHKNLYINNYMISNKLNGDRVKNNHFISTFAFKSAQNHIDSKIIKYMKNNPNEKIYYNAKLIYQHNNDDIPQYMIVNVMSHNKELNEKYQIFNDSKGWLINYKNGKSKYEWGKSFE